MRLEVKQYGTHPRPRRLKVNIYQRPIKGTVFYESIAGNVLNVEPISRGWRRIIGFNRRAHAH